MALEGDPTPPTEVAVGDSPRRVSETPLSPTVPGSDLTNQLRFVLPYVENGIIHWFAYLTDELRDWSPTNDWSTIAMLNFKWWFKRSNYSEFKLTEPVVKFRRIDTHAMTEYEIMVGLI